MRQLWAALRDRDAIAASLFWSWNTLFLAFMLLGFGPQILPDMLEATSGGEIPRSFLAYAALLTALPLLAVALGYAHRGLRGEPRRLLALGYGVEGPLMMLVALRFFGVRQLTPAMGVLLGASAFGLTIFLWQLLDSRIDERGRAASALRAIGMTLLLMLGLYAAVWLAFYIVPGIALVLANLPDVVGELTRGLRRALGDFFSALADLRFADLRDIPWLALPFFLLAPITLTYTGSLVIGLPIMLAWIYGRGWLQAVAALANTLGRRPAIALTATVAALALSALPLADRQPQHEAFALLAEPPATPAEAAGLLARQERIRAGLLNSYLAPQRYLSVRGGMNHVGDLYHEAFGLSDEAALRVQRAYEAWARPLLYQPVHAEALESDDEGRRRRGRDAWRALEEEPAEAAELYARFFDEPIHEAEREVVVDAMRSSWSIDRARADWQAVDDREVYLVSQELRIEEHGDWAEIELHEVYRNVTRQRQEVVYYLTLPESAVVTGLWLGASEDRAARDAFRVSPRGAAQALYRNEVRRNIDPALIEQIGPRQYRLRAFPIEPRRTIWRENERPRVEEGPPMHLWLTMRVLARSTAVGGETAPGPDAVEGEWPLPRLAEHRNVFWDDETERSLDGAPWPRGAMVAAGSSADPASSWLPSAVAATEPILRRERIIALPDGRAIDVRPLAVEDLPPVPADLHLSVVLDRSRSMEALREEAAAALLDIAEALPRGEVDVVLSSSPFRGEEARLVALGEVDPSDTVFFGGQNAAELLAQQAALTSDRDYDAVLVLTDGTGYQLAADDIEVARPRAPAWLVHLGGDLPLGYDDATLEAIQASGGGVAGSVQEALARIAAGRDGDLGGEWIDGYLWSVTERVAGEDDVAGDEPSFRVFAARHHVLAETRRQRADLGAVETLDGIHALAVDAEIVTPYSSMIVLVNEQQERLLDRLERQSDRFERELEAVGDTEGEQAPVVTGVPEPEEWLLMALALVLLVAGMRRKHDPGPFVPV